VDQAVGIVESPTLAPDPEHFGAEVGNSR
jgi:hypothetical protein